MKYKENLHTLQVTLKIPTVVRHTCLARHANFKFTCWSFLGGGKGKRNTLGIQVSSAKRVSDISVHIKAEN